MSIINDVLATGQGILDTLTGESLQESAAPAPAISGAPRKVSGPSRWQAPDASGNGEVRVHRDVLRIVAAAMRSDLKDLDTAVSGLGHVDGATSSLARWTTGSAFNANAGNAQAGVLESSGVTADNHQAGSKKLSDSAQNYDQAETDSQRAASSVGGQLTTLTGKVASDG
jgi:hypothetical protein